MLRPLVELRTGSEQPWEMPKTCPRAAEAVRLPGEAATYRLNSACPAQLVRGIEHFVSRGAMDIAGFGIRQGELFASLGYIKDLADIYYLTREMLTGLEGYGDKRIDNLLAAIENSKQRPPATLTALGIKGVGEVVAEALMAHFGSIDALAAATQAELESIPGIGPTLAQGVVDWFGQEPNCRVVEKLKAAGVNMAQARAEAAAEAQPLAGLTFVITGTLPTPSRDAARLHRQRRQGHRLREQEHELRGGGRGARLKLAKAEQLGVPVIDEAALMALAASLGGG